MGIEKKRVFLALLLTLMMILGMATGVSHAPRLEPQAGLETARDEASSADDTATGAGYSAFLPITVGQPKASFADDFEQGAGRWTPYTNWERLEPQQWYWHPGGGYQGSAGYSFDHSRGKETPQDALTMYLGAGSEGWTNYRARARFNVHDGVKVGLWLRGTYRDQGSPGQWFTGYYCMVRVSASGGDEVQLMQMRTAEDRGDPPEIHDESLYHFTNPYLLDKQKVLADLRHDAWHLLTVEVRGPNVKCWVDDELAIDFADTSGSLFLNGTIGLYVYGGHGYDAVISFDDVIVEPLE